jgi:hypothetical protein
VGIELGCYYGFRQRRIDMNLTVAFVHYVLRAIELTISGSATPSLNLNCYANSSL